MSRLDEGALVELEQLAATEVSIATCACPEGLLDSQAHQSHRQLVDPTVPRTMLLYLVADLRALRRAGLGVLTGAFESRDFEATLEVPRSLMDDLARLLTEPDQATGAVP